MDISTLQTPGAPVMVGMDDLVPSVAQPAQPDARDTARFSELLEDDLAGPADVQAAGAANRTNHTNHTMGDNILSGLQNVSGDLQKEWKGISDSLQGDLSARKLLQVQMGLAGLVLQYELVSKAVTRTTQNIDQLVKLQ